jgi:hypothetical protein
MLNALDHSQQQEMQQHILQQQQQQFQQLQLVGLPSEGPPLPAMREWEEHYQNTRKNKKGCKS